MDQRRPSKAPKHVYVQKGNVENSSNNNREERKKKASPSVFLEGLRSQLGLPTIVPCLTDTERGHENKVDEEEENRRESWSSCSLQLSSEGNRLSAEGDRLSLEQWEAEERTKERSGSVTACTSEVMESKYVGITDSWFIQQVLRDYNAPKLPQDYHLAGTRPRYWSNIDRLEVYSEWAKTFAFEVLNKLYEHCLLVRPDHSSSDLGSWGEIMSKRLCDRLGEENLELSEEIAEEIQKMLKPIDVIYLVLYEIDTPHILVQYVRTAFNQIYDAGSSGSSSSV